MNRRACEWRIGRFLHPERTGEGSGRSFGYRSPVTSLLEPWSEFGLLVEALATLQVRTREAAARSIDEILTLRNWQIGAWIGAYEQQGADRARYGERLIPSLADAFESRGIAGIGRSNLRNYRQIALTWPRLGIRQTPSGASRPALDLGPANTGLSMTSGGGKLRPYA